jgi:hypothetical protein
MGMDREVQLILPSDTIDFVLSMERPITNKTVRMTVQVSAMVGGRSEDEVRKEIHEALSSLVDTKWNLGDIRRTAYVGDELLSLKAVTRVDERENRDLENRARKISKRGLMLSTPQVEYSFPMDEVEQARSDMRLALLTKAHEEAARVNKAVGKDAKNPYRVGHFATTESDEDLASRVSNKGLTVAARYGSTSNDISTAVTSREDLAHTGKIVMYALVVLRREAD